MCRISTLEHKLQRRNAVRYHLQLPVIFHWKDEKDRTEGGFTSDVGLDGALIVSRACPPIGSDIHLEVLIPSPMRNGEELRIECIGKVTRVVEKEGRHAFGVHGTFDDEHLRCQGF
jgi:PilZ domain